VHEVSNAIAADVYVNVQGDEPMVRPEQIAILLRLMEDPAVQVGTLKTPCSQEEIHNPNAVKVVTAADGRALYFSRATIPFDRDKTGPQSFKHLGIYAYRKAALDRFVSLPESSLEKTERLEQLRFLENGIPIYVAETAYDSIGVDTEDDLRRVAEILKDRRDHLDPRIGGLVLRSPGFGSGQPPRNCGMRMKKHFHPPCWSALRQILLGQLVHG